MARPQRIVSLVPSTTESVFALGAGGRLVGCTRYCTEPAAELVRIARVGGTKNPDRERIAALHPDLVLCNGEENRDDDIAWLRQRFTVLRQTPRTVVEAAGGLRELGSRLDAIELVQPFLLRIEAQLAAAEVARLARPPVRVFYPIWRKPWMSCNRDTFIGDVLRTVGAVNVCAGASARYPEVSPAEVGRQRPDIVLLPSEPWEFDVEQRDELAASGIFGDARLVLCDGRDFCWHGTRIAEGLGRASVLVAGEQTGGR